MNLPSIKIRLTKRSRPIKMIVLSLFFIFVTVIWLHANTMIIDQKGPITGQKLRYVGFVLNVDNKAEWKADIITLAQEVNSEINDILVAVTKNDKKNAKRDLMELSFEIVENEKDFKKKMDKIFVITYITTENPVVHLIGKEKVRFSLKKNEEYLETVRAHLRLDLKISKYDKYLK